MKTNQLKNGIYLSYISLFITNLTNLLLTPFIIKNLGQSEYGLYMLIGAFVGYIAVLDFGLGTTTTRYVSKYRAEKDKEGEEGFLFSTIVLYIFISLLILIIGTLMFFKLDLIFGNSLNNYEIEISKAMFLILIINLAFTLPMNLFIGVVTAYEEFIVPKLLTIIRVIIRVIFIVLFLSWGYKAIAIVIIDAILNIIMLNIYIFYVIFKLKVKFKFKGYNFFLYKEIFTYSFLIFISVIVDQIYWKIGYLILGMVAGASEVAIFAIGMMFGQYFITFSTVLSSLFLPRITKMVVNGASGEELTTVLIKTGRIQFLILGIFLSGFIIFGREFLYLWVGNGYESAWLIAVLVMLPLAIVLTQTVGISILQAKNKHGFRAFIYLIISLLNIVISIYMVKVIGTLGAAIGTTFSLVFGNIIVMNIYYHYKIGLNMKRFYIELKTLFFSFFTSLSVGSVFLLNTHTSWILFIIECLMYLAIYSLVSYLLGMNNFEKSLMKSEINKIRSKVIRKLVKY